MGARFFDPNEDDTYTRLEQARARLQSYRLATTPGQASGVDTMARLYGTTLPPGTIHALGSAGVDPVGPEVRATVHAQAQKSHWWDVLGDKVSGAVAAVSNAASNALTQGLYDPIKGISRGTWAGTQFLPQMGQAAYRAAANGGNFDFGKMVGQTDIGAGINEIKAHHGLSGLDFGSGFFDGGNVHKRQVQAARSAAPLINGHAVTAGRDVANRVGSQLNSAGGFLSAARMGDKHFYDQGHIGHSVVSGLIDGVVNLGLDPSTYFGGDTVRGLREAHRTFSGSQAVREIVTGPRAGAALVSHQPKPLPEGVTLEHHPSTDTTKGLARVFARKDGQVIGELHYADYGDGKMYDIRQGPDGQPEHVEITASDHPNNGVIANIHVDDEFRRQGIATAMFDHAQQYSTYLHHNTDLSAAGQAWKDSLASKAGLIDSDTRKTLVPEVAADWIEKSREGRRVVSWLADQTDFNTIWKGTGKKLPVDLVNQLQNAGTQGEVIEAIAPHLGTTVGNKFDVGLSYRAASSDMGVVNAVGKAVRKTDSIRLLQHMPGKHLILDDIDDAVEQFDRFQRNAKLPEEMISKNNQRLAEAYSAGRPAIWDAFRGAMVDISKTLEGQGVKPHIGKALTRAFDHYTDDAAYFIDELGKDAFQTKFVVNGSEVEIPHPHQLNEYINRAIPLPNVRAIRRETGNKAIKALLNTKSGNFTEDLVDALTAEVWVPLRLLRGGFVVRNIAESQLRMAAAGYDNMLTHGIDWLSWVAGDDAKFLPKAMKGRGATDATGQSFRKRSEMAEALDAYGRSLNRRGGIFRTESGTSIQTDSIVRVTKDRPEEYLDGWARELSKIATDDVQRRVIMQDLGKGDRTPNTELTGMDLVKDWFFHGTGRWAWNEMNQDAGFMHAIQAAAGQPLEGKAAADFYIDSLEHRIQVKTGGVPELRQLLADGKLNDVSLWRGDGINPKIKKELANYIESGPDKVVAHRIVNMEGEMSKLGGVAERWKRAVDSAFDMLASRPENSWNNSPVYRQAYWNRIEKMAEFLDADSQAKLMRNANKAKLKDDQIKRLAQAVDRRSGDLDLQTADTIAARHGLRTVGKLLYTNQDRSQFMDTARNIFVFGDALRNTLSAWARLSMENPVAPHRLQQSIYGARQADFNEDGQGFFYRDPQTGQERFVYPGTGALVKHLTGIDTGGFSAPVSGLNIASSSVLPSLGPATSLLASDLLPDRPEYDKIRNLLLPYGAPQGALGGFLSLPPWAQKAAVAAGRGDKNAMASATAATMGYLVSTGDYDLTNPDDVERLKADALHKSKGLYLIRAVAQFVAPAAPKPGEKAFTKDGRLISTFLMSQDYRAMFTQDPNTANEKFIERYGPLAFFLTEPRTQANGTAPATKAASDFARTHPETVRRHQAVYGLFLPADGTFDADAFGRQVARGERSYKDGNQLLDEYRRDLGRFIYERAKTELGTASKSPAGKQQLAGLEDELSVKFGFNKKDYNPGQHDKRVQQLRDALGDPALASTDAGKGLDVYLQARDAVTKVAAQRGVTGWDRAKKTLDLRQKLAAFGEQLVQEYPDFTTMWQRVFQRETD